MSLGESKGGLPPDSVCEEEPAALADMERLITQYHDNSRHVHAGGRTWAGPWIELQA